MRVLILSCNTGGGHNSCSSALKDVFEEQGIVCEVKDSLSYVSNLFSLFMEKGHNAMYRYFSWFFQWGYELCEKHPKFFSEKGCIYRVLKIGAERLYQDIQKKDYNVIICTHVFSALMLTAVHRKHQMKVRTYFVATDYTCSPGVKESILDYYFIPHEILAEEFHSENIREEKIICSGIPVKQAFYEKKMNKEEEGKTAHLLIMCGSMGCGPLLSLIENLVKKIGAPHRVTVVCGSNRKLKKQLEKVVGCNKQFRIEGFVEDMALLMDGADVYMTKPGGLSTTEALNKNIPMIFVNVVAGCEACNSHFFVRHGCAITEDSVEMLVRDSIDLLDNKERRMKMAEHCEKVSDRNSGKLIVDYIRRVDDEDRNAECGL